MKILMLLENEFPPDERVEKEALSLIEAGFEVHVACNSRRGKKKEEDYKGIHIHRKNLSPIMYKLSAAVLVLPFYFWYWKSFVRQLRQKYSFNAVHVHDLPLSRIGYFMKNKYGVRLICDQHEYYSNWIVHTAHYNTFLGKIVKKLSRWYAYEKKYLNNADLVITVAEPLLQTYINEHDIPSEKIICLPNIPLKKVFNTKNVSQEVMDNYKGRFVLIYIGNMDILRGIDLIISSLPELKKTIPNIKLLLIGPCRGGYDPKFTARKYDVEQYVEMLDWRPVEQLPSYIAASDIGIFTPPVNREEINKTIATKIYQYIAMGKPVIVSNARLMKEFVEANEVGFALEDNKPEGFINKVIDIYSNKELATKMSEKGKMISESYSWETTVKVLIDAYTRLLGKIRKNEFVIK